MGDKTIIKVDSTHSPHGPLGQMYLATGVGVGMRLWRDRPPGPPVPEVARDYETVGYVISGRAELHSEGQMSCWNRATRGSFPGTPGIRTKSSSRSRRLRRPTRRLRSTTATARSAKGIAVIQNKIRGSGRLA